MSNLVQVIQFYKITQPFIDILVLIRIDKVLQFWLASFFSKFILPSSSVQSTSSLWLRIQWSRQKVVTSQMEPQPSLRKGHTLLGDAKRWSNYDTTIIQTNHGHLESCYTSESIHLIKRPNTIHPKNPHTAHQRDCSLT